MHIDYADIYQGFNAPINVLDCGKRCAPYNEFGIPFCCDTRYMVPTAYRSEWSYLQTSTDLWHEFDRDDPEGAAELSDEMPDGHVLIACQGYHACQRNFRSLTCRAFPFFPYIDSKGEFLGLSYYWDFRDRCWVINNLHVVDYDYSQQFISTFERIFALMPEEMINFSNHSSHVRAAFSKIRRTIPLLHRNGACYKISPLSEEISKVTAEKFPKYGVYKIAAELLFPDEKSII